MLDDSLTKKKNVELQKTFLSVYACDIFFLTKKTPPLYFKRNVYILYILIQKIFSIFQIPPYTCVHILENQQNGAFVTRRQSYLRIPRDCHWRIQRGRGYMALPPPSSLEFYDPQGTGTYIDGKECIYQVIFLEVKCSSLCLDI